MNGFKHGCDVLQFALSKYGSCDLQRTAEPDKSKKKGEAAQAREGRAWRGWVAMQWTEEPMPHPFSLGMGSLVIPFGITSGDTNEHKFTPHGNLQWCLH